MCLIRAIRDSPLLLVTADVDVVVVGAAITQPMDQPRLGAYLSCLRLDGFLHVFGSNSLLWTSGFLQEKDHRAVVFPGRQIHAQLTGSIARKRTALTAMLTLEAESSRSLIR